MCLRTKEAVEILLGQKVRVCTFHGLVRGVWYVTMVLTQKEDRSTIRFQRCRTNSHAPCIWLLFCLWPRGDTDRIWCQKWSWTWRCLNSVGNDFYDCPGKLISSAALGSFFNQEEVASQSAAHEACTGKVSVRLAVWNRLIMHGLLTFSWSLQAYRAA